MDNPFPNSNPARLVAERLAAAGLLTSRLLGSHELIVGRVGDEHPLMITDQALAWQHPARLLKGLAAVALLGKTTHILLAVREDLAPSLGPLLRAAQQTRIELRTFPPCYPLDDISLLCDLQLADRRALICDAATLNAVGAAVDGVLPRQVVTVVGVTRPSLLQVPCGTMVTEVARACGAEEHRWEAWRNGVLRGGQRVGIDASIDAETQGLLLLPRDHPLVVGESTPLSDDVRRCAACCTNCRVCTDLCPVYLNGGHLRPHLIAKAIALGWIENPRPAGATLAALECLDCRLCDLLCPSHIRPAALVRLVRQTLRERGVGLNSPSFVPAPRSGRSGRRMSLERLKLLVGLSSGRPPDLGIPRPLLPQRLTLPLPPASQPEVIEGQVVSAGALLARAADGAMLLRAPVAGTINAIDDDRIEIQAQ